MMSCGNTSNAILTLASEELVAKQVAATNCPDIDWRLTYEKKIHKKKIKKAQSEIDAENQWRSVNNMAYILQKNYCSTYYKDNLLSLTYVIF